MLYKDAVPAWGKMTPQHMVEHLILTTRCSNGKLRIECFSEKEKLPTLKRFLMSTRPLPKDFINPAIGADLLPLEFPDLETAIENLKIEIKDYFVFFERNPNATPMNPTFGELNRDEWNTFHIKHFKHHFEQFGMNFE